MSAPDALSTAPEVCACGAVAAWYYMPDDRDADGRPCERQRAYCEEHVPRGCSCSADDGPDELGRALPCCEFQWIGSHDDEVDRIGASEPKESNGS